MRDQLRWSQSLIVASPASIGTRIASCHETTPQMREGAPGTARLGRWLTAEQKVPGTNGEAPGELGGHACRE